MSAAALKSLVSAAATSIYDAVGVAETSAELDHLARLVSRGLLDGTICDDDARHLLEYIHLRRPVRRPARQQSLPGLPLPEPNVCRIGRFPKRCVQRSADKQKSYDRRHELAYSGVMPHHLAARLTVGAMAVMHIVANEYRAQAVCDLELDEIAARAGVCRKTARRAMQVAQDQRLISVRERPMRGRKNLTNLVEVISFEWLKWLRRPKGDQQVARIEPVGRGPIGGHLFAPTDNRLEDDGGDASDRAAVPATAAPPLRRQPNKEAIEFATELANISGYRQAAVPESWRDAGRPGLDQRTRWQQSAASRCLAIARDESHAPKTAARRFATLLAALLLGRGQKIGGTAAGGVIEARAVQARCVRKNGKTNGI
jgi:hypothetical protein